MTRSKKKRKKTPAPEESENMVEETVAGEAAAEDRVAEDTVAQEPAVDEAVAPAVEDWRDKYLRTLAELDNFRKRTDRERDQTRRYALESFLRQLLPVLDALHLAADTDCDEKELRKGLSLALSELRRVLSDKGVEEIEALDEAFDPRWHEAVGMLPAENDDAGKVVKQERRGYRMHDRVLRPSRVHISVKLPEAAADAPEEGSGDTIEEE